jgi:SPP1 gp7 family putative phage head morphogenesis protein
MRRNRPFGSRARPLPRSLRKKLSRNDLGVLEGYLPPVSPGEDYADEIYNVGKAERVRFIDSFKELLKKQGESTKRNVVGFLGDFLGLVRDYMRPPEGEKGKEEAERFIGRLNNDNKGKFKSVLPKDTPTIGAFSGEPRVKEALSASVFENVSLIHNLNQKYFNEIQSLVFKQVGIEIEPSEAPHVLTIPEMIGLVETLPTVTDAEGNVKIASGNKLASDIFDVLRKELPETIEKDQEQKLKRRAALIARDQTQKVFNALDAARGKDSGFVWYIWSASGGDNPDNRVRDTHRAHNGKVFHIDFPPEDTGEPGHDVQCRCRKKWLYLKSELSKISEKDLGYTDAGVRGRVASLLPKG